MLRIVLPPNAYVPEVADTRPLIVVRNLDNLHPNGEQQHLCALVADELAEALAHAGLSASRSADLRIAHRLRHYTLCGSVSGANGLIRVDLLLVDVAAGEVLASPSVTGRRDHVLLLTNALVSSIVEALGPRESELDAQ